MPHRGGVALGSAQPMEAGTVLGRGSSAGLLECGRGGYCSVEPLDTEMNVDRKYVPRTFVLSTTSTPTAASA